MKPASRSLHPEWYFLVLSLPFGLAFMALTPPGQVPDEHAHFLRSYQVSEGHLVSLKNGDHTGDYIPSSVGRFMSCYDALPFHRENKLRASQILDTASICIDQSDRPLTGFSNTAIHPPLIYAPQAMGILLARQFTPSVLVLFYTGRLFNLFAATALTFWAIRRAPVGKWMFTVLALTPMMLFMSSSLSSDALTNALSFLFLSQVLLCAFGPGESVSTSNIIALAVLGIAIGQSKQAYFLLAAAYLLIPSARMETLPRYWFGFLVVAASTLLSIAGWGFVVRGIYSSANPAIAIDPRQQFFLMCCEPRWFLSAMLDIAWHSPVFLRQFVGVLGWLDTEIPDWVFKAELIVMAAILLDDIGVGARISTQQALTAVGVASLVILTVCVAIYLTWERVGSQTIGIQGRYFIPIGPLLGLALSRIGSELSSMFPSTTRLMRVVAIACIPSLLLITSLTLLSRYFSQGTL
jgi:uncharacterized membrane protein